MLEQGVGMALGPVVKLAMVLIGGVIAGGVEQQGRCSGDGRGGGLSWGGSSDGCDGNRWL